MRPDCSDCLGICLAAPGPVFPHYFWACLHGKTKCWKTHQTAKERKKTLCCHAEPHRGGAHLQGQGQSLYRWGVWRTKEQSFGCGDLRKTVIQSCEVDRDHCRTIPSRMVHQKMMPWTSESKCGRAPTGRDCIKRNSFRAQHMFCMARGTSQ